MPREESNQSASTSQPSESPRWSQFLDEFESNIDPFQFQVWGSHMTLVGEDDDRVTVQVPKRFHKEWLQEQHGKALKHALRAIYSEQTDLEIRIVEEEDSIQSSPSTQDPEETQSVNRAFPFAKTGGFDRKYTFDRFVVGSSNNLAYTAARALADEPTDSYNPLFIYGGVGLGKTHLLQAIGHRVKDQWEQANVKYMTAEEFTNQIIQAIRDGKTKEFKYRYRNLDMFLVDDVQFLANKEAAQEEFFHTFNELYDNGKGAAFCSDRPPQEISKLEERLRSRLEMGLIVDVQLPDYETRVAILQKKLELEGVSIPPGVIEFIAENVTSNIRALEGSLNRLISLASLSGEKVTLEMAENELTEYINARNPGQEPVQSIDAIQNTVADYFNLSPEDLKSKKRTNAVARPRQIAMYLARQRTNNSYAHIGEEFGGRDHSTVIHGVNKIEESLEDGDEIADHLRRIQTKLKK